MSADITNKGGKDLFAANIARGHPWHRLGEQSYEDMSIEGGLKLIGIENETIELVNLFEEIKREVPHPDFEADDPNAPLIKVTSYDQVPIELFGVKSSIFGIMAPAGARFVPPQRRDVLERAFEITGLDNEGSHIDTIGLLGDRGETFFAYIRQPDLVIDPNGIADVIERGLFTANAWDGSMSRVTGYSSVRVVCANTLSMALGQVKQLIKVRNTRNAEDRIRDAAVALKYSGAVEAELVKRAERMLKVDGEKALVTIQDHFWDLKEDGLSDRAKSQRNRKRDSVRKLYEAGDGLNSNLVGENGWAAYNAFVEYTDHDRDVAGGSKGKTRAAAAVLPGRVWDDKVKASDIVLALGA